MKLKNKDKVAAANQIVEFAKTLGFAQAFLKFNINNDDEEEFFETIEDVANEFGVEDEITVAMNIFLDDELTFEITTDEEIEYK